MSHNPAAVDLGNAGAGNAAHDQGAMRLDGTAEGAQPAATELRGRASGSDIKLAAQVQAQAQTQIQAPAQEVQEQSTQPAALVSRSSRGPDPDPEPSGEDVAVAAKASGAAVSAHAHAHDSTPIHGGELNGITHEVPSE